MQWLRAETKHLLHETPAPHAAIGYDLKLQAMNLKQKEERIFKW